MENLSFRVLAPPMDQTGHTHAYAHILLPLTESLTLFFRGTQFLVSTQELCFIPPHTFHHCFCSAEVITMNIPAGMIRQSDLTTLENQTVHAIEKELIPLVQLIKAEVPQNPNNSSLRYLFYYLYSKLVESHECHSLRYIREHFNEPVSIEALAKMENYNPSYFADWFHRKIGQSPSSYLRWFRVEKAKELLFDTQYSLLDIALLVGYNSHSAFTRAFKEVTSISPQEYRQQTIASLST